MKKHLNFLFCIGIEDLLFRLAFFSPVKETFKERLLRFSECSTKEFLINTQATNRSIDEVN